MMEGHQNLQLLRQQLFFQHLKNMDKVKQRYTVAGQCHMLLEVQIFDSAGAWHLGSVTVGGNENKRNSTLQPVRRALVTWLMSLRKQMHFIFKQTQAEDVFTCGFDYDYFLRCTLPYLQRNVVQIEEASSRASDLFDVPKISSVEVSSHSLYIQV